MIPRIVSLKNQYRGINAHLHSQLQADRLWNRIHGVYITQTMTVLNRQLLTMGYIARIEDSLQIRRVNEAIRLRGDVTIYDTQPSRSVGVANAAFGELVLEDLLEDIEDDHPYLSVAVYEGDSIGEAVAWLEFLSPSNKGSSLDAAKYRSKRENLLRSGIVFVEVDYLHETSPTFEKLFDYSQPQERNNGAFPYRVVTVDPRPDWRKGRIELKQFHVDDLIPEIHIPLNHDDVVALDMSSIYEMTFESAAFGVDIDYAIYPIDFGKYGRTDQALIIRRMIATIAVQENLQVEASALSLEEGQHWLSEWRRHYE